MPSTNTIYSLSELNDRICTAPEADSSIVYTPQKEYLPYVPVNKNNQILPHLIFTICFLIIFAFIRLRGKDILNNLMTGFFKRKKTELVLNEGIVSNSIWFILSLSLSLSVISVILSYFTTNLFITINSLYIFIALFLFHFLLLLVVRILGWIFNKKHTADDISINIWTYNILSGLFCAPFVIALFFAKTFAISQLLKVTVIILFLLLLTKFIRWVKILFLNRVSILYIILYLCALEIIPLLVLYKLVA